MNTNNRIQLLRKSQNLSQEELGEKLYVSRQTVSQWENGQTMPSIESLMKMREIFGVSVDDILGISDITDTAEFAPQQNVKQEESYECQFTEKEFREISYASIRPVKKIILIISILSVLLFIFMFSTKQTGIKIFFGALFGGLIANLISNLKILSITKKDREATIAVIENRKFSYSVSDGILTIKVTKDGQLISEENRPLDEIRNINDTGTHYILVISGRVYFIRKSDLPENSKLSLYLKSKVTVKIAPSKPDRKWRIISDLTFVASIFSIFLGLAAMAIVSEITGQLGGFVNNMWTMFIFLPIPVFSIVLGFILKSKNKGYKYVKNIVVGIVMCFVLFLYGSFSFMFSGMNNAMDTVKEEMNINIPEHIGYTVSTGINSKNKQTMKGLSICEVRFSFDGTVEFDKSLTDSWVTEFSDEFDSVIAVDEERYRASNCLLYNVDTKEYNTVPKDDGEYNMILLLFSKSTSRLYILQYKLIER